MRLDRTHSFGLWRKAGPNLGHSQSPPPTIQLPRLGIAKVGCQFSLAAHHLSHQVVYLMVNRPGPSLQTSPGLSKFPGPQEAPKLLGRLLFLTYPLLLRGPLCLPPLGTRGTGEQWLGVVVLFAQAPTTELELTNLSPPYNTNYPKGFEYYGTWKLN